MPANNAHAIVLKQHTKYDFTPHVKMVARQVRSQRDAARALINPDSSPISKGSISYGSASRPPIRDYKKGKWKWSHQERSTDMSLGPDPQINDGLGRRLQESNWWMMANLNKRPKDDYESKTMVDAMSYALTKIRNNPSEWGGTPGSVIFTWGPDRVAHLSDDARAQYKNDGAEPLEYINKLEIEAPTAEIGPVKGRLHVHFQLYVSHWSCIHLDSKGFGKRFKHHYNQYMNKERVAGDSHMRIQHDRSVLIWARLTAQKNAHNWMHKYAAKGQD